MSKDPQERCGGSGKLPHAMTNPGGTPFGPDRKCPGCPDCSAPTGTEERHWPDLRVWRFKDSEVFFLAHERLDSPAAAESCRYIPAPSIPLGDREADDVDRIAQIIAQHVVSEDVDNQPDFCRGIASEVLAALAGPPRRRWKLWRIERDGDDWAGVTGPATNPPDDCGLKGEDWIEAATVEVVEAHPAEVEKGSRFHEAFLERLAAASPPIEQGEDR